MPRIPSKILVIQSTPPSSRAWSRTRDRQQSPVIPEPAGVSSHALHFIFGLVVLTILKNMSQWEGLSHTLWKNKKCSKPPTRYLYHFDLANHLDLVHTWSRDWFLLFLSKITMVDPCCNCFKSTSGTNLSKNLPFEITWTNPNTIKNMYFSESSLNPPFVTWQTSPFLSPLHRLVQCLPEVVEDIQTQLHLWVPEKICHGGDAIRNI